MFRAIFKNPNTGKYYTMYEDSNRNARVAPVFLPHTWWDKSGKKQAKNGQDYIVAAVVKKTSNEGWPYFILKPKEED